MSERVHLVGIGGAGISAIARVLLERGVTVTGSDRERSEYAAALEEEGVDVWYGHAREHVHGADVVVASSAIPEDNVELREALDQGIPAYRRPAYLPMLLQGQRTIAVAGTHGKTTTTGMLAWILSEAGKAPGFIVGGMLPNFGTNAHAGTGQDFVIEADEYKQTFLSLTPSIGVVTNVEHDHPDCYPTYEDCVAAFQAFVDRVQDVLVVSADDAGAAGLSPAQARRVTYGISHAAQWTLMESKAGKHGGMHATLIHEGEDCGTMQISLDGSHNLLNALAAAAGAYEAGIPIADSLSALASYQGAARRFQILGQAQHVTVVDDYAHHPTEIKATLAAARARYPDAGIWAVFQPHTYSRTRTLLTDLRTAFADADHVLVTDIFAAREVPDGVTTGAAVAAALDHVDSSHAAGLSEALDILKRRVAPGDVVITLSAGDANQIGMEFLAWLHDQKGDRSHDESL